MQKQFIVKTPFGIGVATSEEDLKDMLSFVEGITGEGAEQGEAQQEEDDIPSEMDPNLEALRNLLENGVVVKPKNVECDCENCQHNAQLSEKRLTVFADLVVATASPGLLDFMKGDIESDINAATLALGKDHPQVVHLDKMLALVKERITELTGENDADKVEGKTTWGKRNPDLLDLEHVSKTVDIGADMLASINLGYAVTKPQMVNLISRSIDILDEYLKSEVEKMNTQEAPVEDSSAEELQGKHAFSFEAINDMTDHDELDKLQIELEGKMSQLSDKKQAEVDRFHEEMKRLEDLHATAAGRKAEILDNKADIAHADMADKVKALQEAITRSQPHLLIHDDIREAMQILQERYRK